MSIVYSSIIIQIGQSYQLDVIDEPPYDDILYSGDSHYFSILNLDSDCILIANISAFQGNYEYPNIEMTVFTWNNYYPSKSNGLDKNITSTFYGKVSFECNENERYLLRLTNLDENAVFNITFISDSGAIVPSSGYSGDHEQFRKEGIINIGYYYTTDPWLYDSYDSASRGVIMIGYDQYFAQAPIIASGERYFLINNYYDDVNLFVGVHAYTLDPYYNTPNIQIGVYDWEDLDDGIITPIAESDTMLNYSCGFNFTCEKGHIYQVYFKNYDSAYGVFLNATFYSWGESKVRFAEDWTSEEDDDQIKVRVYLENPWLEYSREKRNALHGWLWGIGIVGALFSGFWIKVRYF